MCNEATRNGEMLGDRQSAEMVHQNVQNQPAPGDGSAGNVQADSAFASGNQGRQEAYYGNHEQNGYGQPYMQGPPQGYGNTCMQGPPQGNGQQYMHGPQQVFCSQPVYGSRQGYCCQYMYGPQQFFGQPYAHGQQNGFGHPYGNRPPHDGHHSTEHPDGHGCSTSQGDPLSALLGPLQEMIGKNPGLSSINSILNIINNDLLKGIVLGAGITMLFSNESVQDILQSIIENGLNIFGDKPDEKQEQEESK